MQSLTSTMYNSKYQTSAYSAFIASEPGCRMDSISNIETVTGNAVSEVKTVFFTPEGIYRQMTISDFVRSNRLPINQSCPISNTLVRLSVTKVEQMSEVVERTCFNVGREIYVYDYELTIQSLRGAHSDPNTMKLIDKRVYKGTFPTCHDFNVAASTSNSTPLIVGFTAGQIQLLDPCKKDGQSWLFNEDRSIDKTAVTHLRWIPGEPSQFMASHASGHLYVYNEKHAWLPTPPVYQSLKNGDHYAVHTTKSKTPRNPVTRWTLLQNRENSSAVINQFEFWPPATNNAVSVRYLATAGQDGYLRIYDYAKLELVGLTRSYYGGILCLGWSPDGRLLAFGGEDDLIGIYSMAEGQVICRGQGHKSFVSQVAFDSKMSVYVGASPQPSLEVTQKISEERDEQETKDSETSTSHLNGAQSAYRSKISMCKFLRSPIYDDVSDIGLLIWRHVHLDSPTNVSGARRSRGAVYALFNVISDLKVAVRWKIRSSNPQAVERLQTFPTAGETSDASRANCINNGTSAGDDLTSSAQSVGGPRSNRTAGEALPLSQRNSYRLGSVGYDTQLCLWDLTEDLVNGGDCDKPLSSIYPSSSSANNTDMLTDTDIVNEEPSTVGGAKKTAGEITLAHRSDQPSALDLPSTSGTTSRTDSTKKKLRKFGLLLGDRLRGGQSASSAQSSTVVSTSCRQHQTNASGGIGDSASIGAIPHFPIEHTDATYDRVVNIAPLVCKKIANEGVTDIKFRDNCIMTCCQYGFWLVWKRPEARSPSPINSKTRYYSTSSASNAAENELS